MADARYDEAIQVQLDIDLISTGSYVNCQQRERDGATE